MKRETEGKGVECRATVMKGVRLMKYTCFLEGRKRKPTED